MNKIPESSVAPDSFSPFWQRWKAVILIACIAVFGLPLAWQATNLIAENRERKVQKAFQQLGEDAEARRSFTQRYPQTRQAGVAYLQLAHESYRSGRYTEAAEFYEAASRALPKGPWRDRAILGMTMAKVFLLGEGNASGFKELMQDESLMESTRAEAAYHQAVLDWKAGDFVAARESINFINTLHFAGIAWKQKGLNLLDKIPSSFELP